MKMLSWYCDFVWTVDISGLLQGLCSLVIMICLLFMYNMGKINMIKACIKIPIIFFKTNLTKCFLSRFSHHLYTPILTKLQIKSCMNKNYFTKFIIFVVENICFIIHKNVDKNFNKHIAIKFQINFDKCFDKNFHINFNQNADKNFGKSEICSYNCFLPNKNFLEILLVDTQNLAKLILILFSCIYFSTVNYIYLLKTCNEKILKISYIENSATYLTVCLHFAQISEIKSHKIHPFIFYAARLYLNLFKVILQVHFLKHYKLFKKLLSSYNFIFHHGS